VGDSLFRIYCELLASLDFEPMANLC